MTDGGLVAARAFAYGALLLAAGLPLYLMTAGRGMIATARLRLAQALVALLAAVASVWLALAGIAAMAALPLAALDGATVSAVLAATPLGAVLAIRLAALALMLLAIGLRLPTIWAALPATVALATAAWTGHAGATEAALGTMHRLADVIHLLAAATWLGALAMLLAGVIGLAGADDVERRLAGFATTGSIIVALLVLTGLANTLAIAGWPLPLASTWTLLLAIKLAMFAGMLGLAALNRWRLTPALAAGRPDAQRNLRLSLMAEAALGLGVVALVALLGVLDPAA
jgi:putative copper resistance protein D